MDGGREIQIDGMSLQQLDGLKKQLDGEMTNLTQSLGGLRNAEQRYQNSKFSLTALTPEHAGREILVPLTQSVYVSGTVADVTEVMVDIGTGYYASKTIEQANAYVERKLAHLRNNISSLEQVVTMKRQNLETLVGVMQEKLMQEERAQQTAQVGQ